MWYQELYKKIIELATIGNTLQAIGALAILRSVFKKIFATKIYVYFDEKATYDKRVIAGAGGKVGIFVHAFIAVKGVGHRHIKDCRGEIVKIEEFKNNRFAEHIGYRNACVVTKWANEVDFRTIDIYKENPRKLDLAFTVENDVLFRTYTERTVPRGVQLDFPKGKYRFSIRISGQNIKSIVKKYLISFDGVWNNIKVLEDNRNNYKTFVEL